MDCYQQRLIVFNRGMWDTPPIHQIPVFWSPGFQLSLLNRVQYINIFMQILSHNCCVSTHTTRNMTAVRKRKAHKGPWEIWGNFRGRKLCLWTNEKTSLEHQNNLHLHASSNSPSSGFLKSHPHNPSPISVSETVKLKTCCAKQQKQKSFRHH